jgi:hypothetical protein
MDAMQTQGIVHNGAIIVEGGIPFPEGTRVLVSAISPAQPASRKTRIKLPLVHGDQPGSIVLTNERIGELFDEEDAAPRY